MRRRAPALEHSHPSALPALPAPLTASPWRAVVVLGAHEPRSPRPPSQPRLLALCAEVLARSFSDAVLDPAFCRCSGELLHATLQRDDVSCDSELDVLQARS